MWLPVKYRGNRLGMEGEGDFPSPKRRSTSETMRRETLENSGMVIRRRNGVVIFRFVLILALTFSPALVAPANPQTPESRVVLEVVEGEGTSHDLSVRAPAEIVLQVTDGKGKPIGEAVVVFQLPSRGPGASFLDGIRFSTVFTREDGRAKSPLFRSNTVPGDFEIVVTASYRDYEAATLSIKQTNSEVQTTPASIARKRGGSRKIVVILALIGGGAAGAVFGLSGGGNGSSASAPVGTPPSSPTTLIPSTPSFGPPR